MKKCAAVLMLSFLITFLPGCGQSEDTSSSVQSADASSAAQEAQEGWLRDGPAAPKELTTDQALWAGSYLPVKHTYDTAGEVFLMDYGVCGQRLWYLFSDAESEFQYFLEIYDTTSEESTLKSFTPEDMGITDEFGHVIGMDMLDETHYVFRWGGYEQDEEGMYRQRSERMIYTDLAGTSDGVEYWTQFLEKGIVTEYEDGRELPLVQDINWRSDKEGNICVLTQGGGQSFRLCLFDRKGELLLEKVGTNTQTLTTSLLTPKGEFLFPVYNNSGKCYEFLWADTAEKQLRPIIQIQASRPDIVRIYGMLGDDIYYRSQDFEADRIVKWNVITGERDLVFDLRENGPGTGFDILMSLRRDQTPVLYVTRYKQGQRMEWLVTLQEQKPAETEAVRVSNLVSSGVSQELVKSCALSASMENPNVSYSYENSSAEEARTRILAELTQGKGPDLLLVSLEDMEMLAEKGVLLDIRELLSAELSDEILPGALEIGTIDGKLFGIPPTVTVDTLVAATDVWSKDTWKLEDIISLMEEGKLTCALRNLPYMMMGQYLAPGTTVNALISNSLQDSFLIDWEHGKCHFDDERFIRLLELCSTDLSVSFVDPEVWLNGGRDILWGYFGYIGDLYKFYEHIGMENGRNIGYPTECGTGSYLKADGGVLAVNVNADPGQAADFLETLLGWEIQSKIDYFGISVRRLSWEDCITERDGKVLYNYSGQEMPVFADGDTPFHRAKAFLESCTAAPYALSPIRSILIEEINAMYAENRSPREAAKNINNRVQLYLDENN